jgi:hypothetical protein
MPFVIHPNVNQQTGGKPNGKTDYVDGGKSCVAVHEA